MHICEETQVGESASRQVSHGVRSANSCGFSSYVMGRPLWCGKPVAAIFALLVVFVLWPAFYAQGNSHSKVQLFTRVHPAMGTDFTLYIYAADATEADREAERVFAIVDRLESLLSNYQPQSELSRINANASGRAVTTDPETFRFLKESIAWSARSDGAFDITVGKLMKAWGFFRSRGHVPTDAELAQVRAETGWKRVSLNADTRTVRFRAPGVELDPGGIGKGFAVDAAINALRGDKVKAALLSAGSSTIYGLGAPPDARGWKVRVPDPERKDGVISTVTLRDTSLSTANCSEKHFVAGGHQYCHIMDPRTLHPVEGRLQATVIAPSATDSDALSNAIFVLDGNGRRRLMGSLPTADAALVVLVDGSVERYRWAH
jgi:thiamine biosynthesis lipoprotein